MTLTVADRIQETTSTTGTGTYTLAGAKSGFQSFAVVGDGNTTYYACTDGTDYEVGIGTYTLSGTTLARTTIIESSNSNAAVNWGAGSKDIFVTLPSSKAIIEDASNNVTIGNNISVGGTVDGVDIAQNIPSSLGSAGQVLTVNASATYAEWATSAGGGYGVTIHANQAAMLTDAASASEGTLHYETDNNKLYVKQTSGFYLLASITNSSPTINSFSENTGGAGDNNLTSGGTFTLTSGSNTVVTINATDPDLETIVYSATVTSGTATDVFSSPSFPVTNQSSNVFTLTPVTSGNGGTVTIRFDASDGTNVANVSHSFELVFQITDSHYTSLLVATDAAAGDNNDITDSSSNSYTITASGDAHAGTFSPYRHGGYSTYFDGSGDYLSLSASDDWGFGNGAWTVEFWINTTDTDFDPVSAFNPSSPFTGWGIRIESGLVKFFVSDGSSSDGFDTVSGTTTVNDGSWHHVALTSASGSNAVSCYVDGTLAGSHTFTVSISTSGQALRVGADTNTSILRPLNGYMSDVRIVKGTAITPPSGGPIERLTAITNTSLLTCHLPYISDGSSNNHTITVNGNVSTNAIGPYDHVEYSESNNGGSLYFDGTGDYVRISSIADLSGGSYTIEGWYYFEADPNSSNTAFWALNTASQNGYAWLFTSGTTLYIQQRGTGTYSSSGTYDFDVNRWYHIATVWNNSANTMRVYVNGEQVISSSLNAIQNAGNGFTLGADGYGSNLITGFVSDFRIKQTAEYTAEFTPPSAPLSSSSTVLHIKGTDAHVLDKSQGDNLKLVGNAAAVTNATNNSNISSTNAVYFNGGDYLISDTCGDIGVSGLDYTIEAWIYITAWPTAGGGIFSKGTAGTTSSGDIIALDVRTNEIRFHGDGNYVSASLTTSTSLSLNTWYHVAVSREGNVHRLFLNGTLEGSKTQSYNVSSTSASYVGTNQYDLGASTRSFYGYMQDVRITKGLARYTSNFTVPSGRLEG